MSGFACPHCGDCITVRLVARGGAAGRAGAVSDGPDLPQPAVFLGRANTDGRAIKNPAAAVPVRAQQTQQEHRQQAAQSGTICPVHFTAKPSRFGGLYCPRRAPDGGWCKWRPEHEEGAA